MNKSFFFSILISMFAGIAQAQNCSPECAEHAIHWSRGQLSTEWASGSAALRERPITAYIDQAGTYNAATDKTPYRVQQKDNGSSVVRFSDDESTVWTFTVKSDTCDEQVFTFWQNTAVPAYGFFRDGENDYKVARYFFSDDVAMVHGEGFLYLVHWYSGMVMDMNTGEIFE